MNNNNCVLDSIRLAVVLDINSLYGDHICPIDRGSELATILTSLIEKARKSNLLLT